MEADQEAGFGVYIHWPFCLAKCPYCDFNSHVSNTVDHDAWRKALLTDLVRQSKDADQQVVTSVFFGGGTPSLMDPQTVGALLDEIGRLFPVSNRVEVTLEANPTSVEAEKFRAFKLAGVNRISMGVQALNDADLKALGRMHSSAEAIAAFQVAHSVFERVSFDLIYARQRQTLAAWEAELRQALSYAVGHLSLYQLTIEQGTRFGDLYDRNKLRDLPDGDLAADMYDLTQAVCADHGYPAYEISNHAAAGEECAHNLTYWRYGQYLGVGPGAHGRLVSSGTRIETQSALLPSAWLERVAATDHGRTVFEPLDQNAQGSEYVMMALRLVEGMSLSRYEALTGTALRPSNLPDLISQQFVAIDGDRLAITPNGRPVLNEILRQVLT